MSDNFMNSETFDKMINQVAVPMSTKVLEPSASRLGEGLGDLFGWVFSPVKLALIKKEYAIEQYKKEMEQRLAKIESKNLIEPPLNIAGPALEAAKYYIEDEEIRKLFTNLIASSMDLQVAANTHPSFTEIIKQLNPNDAINLKYLFENQYKIGFGELRINLLNGNHVVSYKNFFPFPNLNIENSMRMSASVDNLIRLGLISVSMLNTYSDKDRYNSLQDHPFFLAHCLEFNHKKQTIDDFKDASCNLIEGIWQFTAFGQAFSSCCL